MKRAIILIAITMLLSSCVASPKAKTGNPTIDAMEVQQLGDSLVRALDERATLMAQAETDSAEIERLQQLVQGVQFTDPEFPAITRLQDGTDRAAFNKPSSYILLPEGLAYPGVQSIAVSNRLLMGGDSGVSLGMTPIWSFRLEGNKLFLSSTTGIYGELVLGRIGGEVDLNMLNTLFDGHPGQEELLDDWGRVTQVYIPKIDGLKNTIPADPGKDAGKDGVISWMSRHVGRQVSLNTAVVNSSGESHSAVIRVGAFAVQNNAVLYSFIYESAYDSANEEIILALLSSIAIQNRSITLEF